MTRSGQYWLVSSVVGKCLFAIKAHRLDGGQIVEAKQAGVFWLRRVGMLVPGPRRHTEYIVFLPVETPAIDNRITTALGHLIQEAAGMPMSFSGEARGQQLHAGTHGRHDMSARGRIRIVHQVSVKCI